MAHFVKLIGSLQLDGTGLVPLNFSLDYATKTLAAISTVQYITTALPCRCFCLPCKLQKQSSVNDPIIRKSAIAYKRRNERVYPCSFIP